MPGTPSFRGCEACHRQKKKCDEMQPACSRCTRLRIKCEGRGRQRYQFKHSFQNHNHGSEILVLKPIAKYRWLAPKQLVPKSPSSQFSLTASSFVSILNITDPRYDLSCYATWMVDLPQRMGTNEALDATMNAMTLTFPIVHSGELPYQALDSYGKALTALRNCLMDPKKAMEPETLGAIYLISICQGWIGKRSHQETAHILAMIHILRTAQMQRARELSDFEKVIRRTVAVSIIYESFGNPSVRMGELTKALAESENPRILKRPDGSGFPSLHVLALTQFPEFFEHPIRNIEHIKLEHDLLQEDTPKMLQTTQLLQRRIDDLRRANLKVPPIFARQFNLAQAAYGLLLALNIAFGAIIAAYELNEDHMHEPLDSLIEKVLVLAEVTASKRPLGTSYISLPLAAASAATKNMQQRDQIDEMLDAYETDFSEHVSENDATRLRKILEKVKKIRLAKRMAQLDQQRVPLHPVRIEARV